MKNKSVQFLKFYLLGQGEISVQLISSAAKQHMRSVDILTDFIRRTGMHARLMSMFYVLDSQILFQSTRKNCFYQLKHRVMHPTWMQGYNVLAFFGVSLDPLGIVALNSVVYGYICILQLYLCGAGLQLASRIINKLNVVFYKPSVCSTSR